MTAKCNLLILLFVCGMLPALSGCFGSSQSSRFYTLTTPKEQGGPSPARLDRLVAVGPVNIPDYLDRNQIVTRSGGNEIFLAEFDRWGGPLDGEITRALVSCLSDQLKSRHVAVIPWRSAPGSETSVMFRIPVNVLRFDGTPGGKVVLDATWGVFVKGERLETPVFATESIITEDVNGRGYDALVAAMGNAVERLAKEMADSIIKISAGKNENR